MISNIWRSPQLPSLVAPTTTDRDGRFEVRGIGEGQIAHFHLSGPGIETAIVSVRTDETGDTITLPLTKLHKTKISFTYYPSNFEHIAGPSVPVSGVVTASDTGDPISGATVKSEGADRDIVRAITDENGRYRLEGLPIRKRNNIAVLPPSGTSNDGDRSPSIPVGEKNRFDNWTNREYRYQDGERKLALWPNHRFRNGQGASWLGWNIASQKKSRQSWASLCKRSLGKRPRRPLPHRGTQRQRVHRYSRPKTTAGIP